MSAMINQAYIYKRPDIVRLVHPSAKRVLDVGCSTGVLGGQVKELTGAYVVGVELSETMANEAAKYLDEVYIGDATELIVNGFSDGSKFDTIIFSDLLEHLIDPWSTLNTATKYLDHHGVVIASIPNIRHISTLCNLVFKGYWPYQDRGIHDKTHLRFFTKKNIVELFEGANLKLEVVKVNYRFFDKPLRVNRFARYFALPFLRNFLAYQYVVRAVRI